MPQIIALHSVLRPGREEAYDAAHMWVPDELIEAHRRAGIHDWRIWRSCGNLFHLVECDDFSAALRELEREPANERWQAFIGDYVDHFEEAPSGECRCHSSGACAIRPAPDPKHPLATTIVLGPDAGVVVQLRFIPEYFESLRKRHLRARQAPEATLRMPSRPATPTWPGRTDAQVSTCKDPIFLASMRL